MSFSCLPQQTLSDNTGDHIILCARWPSSISHVFPRRTPAESGSNMPLSGTLPALLSCWGVEKLPLPATISLRLPPSLGSTRSIYQQSPAGHRRVGLWDWSGGGGAVAALTDSTDNHCNGRGVRKVEGKQLFPQMPPPASSTQVILFAVREGCGGTEGVKNYRKEGEKITGGDAHWGLRRRVVRWISFIFRLYNCQISALKELNFGLVTKFGGPFKLYLSGSFIHLFLLIFSPSILCGEFLCVCFTYTGHFICGFPWMKASTKWHTNVYVIQIWHTLNIWEQ